ncbi:MAG: hypothetical protein HDS03_04000, partial [Bacteroides sp.]|nr:hypothetical protein [Bacteroides sp.]
KRVHIIRDNKKLISNQTLEVVTSLSHNQGVLGSSPSGTTSQPIRIFLIGFLLSGISLNLPTMNATISLDGLWAIIDSLSIKNKRWLVNKLLSSLSASNGLDEDTILEGLAQSIREVNEGKTQPIDTLWSQL